MNTIKKLPVLMQTGSHKNMIKPVISLLSVLMILLSCSSPQKKEKNDLREVSGIYPHLAYYNRENECGTGAVVPWTGRLWVITYGPHLPFGSSDKL